MIAVAVAAVSIGRRVGASKGVVAGASIALGCLALAGPWSWYASRQAHTPVLISSGGASNLFVGTYLPGDGRMFGLKRRLEGEVKSRRPALRDVPAANIPQSVFIDTVAARRPELGREQALRAEALSNPRRYALGTSRPTSPP